ncbi:MAG: potassium-transporting ATPase subunit C, partial [Candidatus Binatia bacterium]
MKSVFSIAVRTTIVTLVLTGLIYPFVMTGVAQVLFPWRANGSLITDEKGQVIGSELIAQGFANPAHLQPRPSAAGEKGYDAASSSGSN